MTHTKGGDIVKKKELPPLLDCVTTTLAGIIIYFTLSTCAVGLGCTFIWLISKL